MQSAFGTRSVSLVMTGQPTPKKPSTRIKAQFAQTIAEQFVQTLPPFRFFFFGLSRNRQKEFAQTVCANSFYLGGCFLGWVAFPRGPKNQRKLFLDKVFSRTPRVMDVRAENHVRPHQNVLFPAAPVVGRNFLTCGHPGVRVRNVCGKSGPKSLCLSFFS